MEYRLSRGEGNPSSPTLHTHTQTLFYTHREIKEGSKETIHTVTHSEVNCVFFIGGKT